MLTNRSNPTQKAAPKEARLQVLVAPFKDLRLALRLEGIQKVIRMPEIFKSGEKSLGVAHIGDREAIVVDLHQKIYGCPNSQPERYLVVVQAGDRLYGIPVTTLPTIMMIPASALHDLPLEYRDRDSLGIASHVATLPHGTETKTLFLLDPAHLFD
jgi:chemotaxis signal transduction protein